MSLPFKPLGNRVVIKADREDHAPETTDSGLILAKTLAAAVDGTDSEESWFVGTVVGVGPLVNQWELRRYLRSRLLRLGHAPIMASALWEEIESLPTECPEPVRIGDRVTFSWASGQQIMVDGEKYLIMKAEDVLAVLEPESEAV